MKKQDRKMKSIVYPTLDTVLGKAWWRTEVFSAQVRFDKRELLRLGHVRFSKA